jgi:hypothetical protein
MVYRWKLASCTAGMFLGVMLYSLVIPELDWDLLFSAAAGCVPGWLAVSAVDVAAKPGVGVDGLFRVVVWRLFRRKTRIVYKDELV